MVILHEGLRMDTGEKVKGFVVKMWGIYHILPEQDMNTAYPVSEQSIQPCLDTTSFKEAKSTNILDKNLSSYAPGKGNLRSVLSDKMQELYGVYRSQDEPNFASLIGISASSLFELMHNCYVNRSDFELICNYLNPDPNLKLRWETYVISETNDN